MLRFIAGGVGIYAVHAGTFYALTAPEVTAIIGLPAFAVPPVTSAVLFVAVWVRAWFDTMNEEPFGDVRESFACALWSVLVPVSILELLWHAEPPETGRPDRIADYMGSLAFLLVFYALVAAGTKFPIITPWVAIVGGATVLLVQIVTLALTPKDWLRHVRIGNAVHGGY